MGWRQICPHNFFLGLKPEIHFGPFGLAALFPGLKRAVADTIVKVAWHAVTPRICRAPSPRDV
jgi:hypothetical protein